MKRAFYFLAIVLFYSCSKNEGGKLVCNMTYNLASQTSKNENSLMSLKSSSVDDKYSQFGDYITGITPSVFIIKFGDLRLCRAWENQNNNIRIIDGNTAWSSTERIADFSNNATVNINVNSNISEDSKMIYLVSTPIFYYQEFELPAQYLNFNVDSGINNLTYLSFGGNNIDYITADAEIGGVKEGLTVKGSNNPLMAPIFDKNWTGFDGNLPEMPHTTVYGNTDSTFIYYSPLTDRQPTKDNPLAQGGYIIRSNKYNPVTVKAIPEGKTETIIGIMTFNTTNLIQIYAGKDNIPYTSDDIFVYAPKYWERISVSLNSY